VVTQHVHTDSQESGNVCPQGPEQGFQPELGFQFVLDIFFEAACVI
jgi:hypothetical protein